MYTSLNRSPTKECIFIGRIFCAFLANKIAYVQSIIAYTLIVNVNSAEVIISCPISSGRLILLSLVKNIKFLCDEKRLTFAELERNVGISNGQIRRWDNSSPKTENVQKVADYFNVSVDYLLGRTDDLEIQTIAAHHDGDEWTGEELEEIERFKEFVRMKRKQQE